MSAQTAGPDIEGVQERHWHKVTKDGLTCTCGDFKIIGVIWPEAKRRYNAHVAAAVRAEVGRWLEGEGARDVLAEARVPSTSEGEGT